MGKHASPLPRYEYYLRKTAQAFEKLGGYVCKHCGFNDPRALQIDHVFADAPKGQTKGRSVMVYVDVLRTPEKFQVLCANCNWIKRVENREDTKWRIRKNEPEV